MDLTLTRLDDRRYETLVTRDDGVRLLVNGVGHMFAIPHDLAHLAVEGPLQLSRGFWGSIAAGAVFPSMHHVSGRRRPGATERSRDVLRANKDQITEAETLVSVFNTALQEGHGSDFAILRARLREGHWSPPGQAARRFTDAEVAAVCEEWRRMLSVWQPLTVGGTLHFVWSVALFERRSRKG